MIFLLALAILAYLLAAASVIAWLSVGEQSTRRTAYRNAAQALGPLAVFAHAAVHTIAWHVSGGPDLHFFSALSLVALGVAALTALAAWWQQLQSLGIVAYPLAAVMLVLYHFGDSAQVEQLDWQLQLHVWFALPAYILLSLAALLASMLWLQERALRRKQIRGWLRTLPPLTQLEQLLFHCITAGFVLLTLAMVTGILFVHSLLNQHLWHKTVLTALSWLVFGWLLFGRWRYGWRGPRAVKFTLSAMALLLLAFFGSKFVLELVLHRGD
jgi:ABC-type uncharacterized transport system permease subunit